ETWRGQQRVLGAEHHDTLDTMSTYLWAVSEQGKLEEAERLARQCFQSFEHVFGPDDMDTIDALGNLGHVLANRGDFAGAERCERESVARFQRLGLADKEGALYSLNNLAMYLCMLCRPEQAEKLLAEARPVASRKFGPELPVTIQLQHSLARVLSE